MKQRLLVMNGQKLVQHEEAGEWVTDEVKKAPNLKPGIYNIHLGTPADRKNSHDGMVVHADEQYVYQQVGKSFVRHDRLKFDKVPEIGTGPKIEYEGNKARVAAASVKRGRKLTQ